MPHPPTSRQEIQELFAREMEIDPNEYYPPDYSSDLLEDWPVSSDLVVPLEDLPPQLERSMGESWRKAKENRKALGLEN